ncbi:MAG: rhodanese-like domain-containing protein [Actinomycetota bacterium]|nr:rhodanese-like domain-containing protein [Actinomycetota bacterium]
MSKKLIILIALIIMVYGWGLATLYFRRFEAEPEPPAGIYFFYSQECDICMIKLQKIEKLAQVSENQERGNPDIKIISVDQAYELFTEDSDEYLFIEVRTEGEFSGGHIQGALNIPVSKIQDSIDQLPRDRFLVVYCNGSNCDQQRKSCRNPDS